MARKKSQSTTTKDLPSKALLKNVRQTTKTERAKTKYGSVSNRKKVLLAKRENKLDVRSDSRMGERLKKTKVRPSADKVSSQRAVAQGRLAINQPIRSTFSNLNTGKNFEDKVRSKVKYQRKGPTTTRLQKAEKYLEKRGTRAANMPMKGTTKTNLMVKKGVSKVYDKLGRVSQITGKRSIKKRYKVLGAIGAYAAYRSVKNKNKEQGR